MSHPNICDNAIIARLTHPASLFARAIASSGEYHSFCRAAVLFSENCFVVSSRYLLAPVAPIIDHPIDHPTIVPSLENGNDDSTDVPSAIPAHTLSHLLAFSIDDHAFHMIF